MATTPAEVQAAIERAQPGILERFLRWVGRIVGSVVLQELVALIREGRIEEIPAMLRLGKEGLSPLTEAIRTVLADGGETVEAQRGIGALIQFDMRNTAVENWVEQHSSDLITKILTGQRNAIREVVRAGLEAGRNPNAIALDIVGRLDKAAGKRVGGIVGLTEQQAGYVVNARRELEALDSRYFDRLRRDKRFDAIVRKAIKSGKPLSQVDIDRIIGRYADRLLLLRGETIAHAEALSAMNAGRELAMQQAIDSGVVDAKYVTSIWETAHDKRVRDSHRAMQGQTVPFGTPFTTPRGAKMRYPGDTSLGATADEVIACRCIQRHRIDFIGRLVDAEKVQRSD